MTPTSKPLRKPETSVQRLIKAIMGEQPTYAIDVEMIMKTGTGWVMIEFLKCDSRWVTPATSHPRRYWWKNWRKFLRLWEIAVELDAQLILVNYEERTQGIYGRYRIMDVDTRVRPTETLPVRTRDIEADCTREEFAQWLSELNSRANLIR